MKQLLTKSIFKDYDSSFYSKLLFRNRNTHWVTANLANIYNDRAIPARVGSLEGRLKYIAQAKKEMGINNLIALSNKQMTNGPNLYYSKPAVYTYLNKRAPKCYDINDICFEFGKTEQKSAIINRRFKKLMNTYEAL